MVVATPASVVHVFAQHGVLVSRAASPPEICYPGGCTGLDTWGGGGAVYFKPWAGKDFMVILFKHPSDAASIARLGARNGLGSERRRAVVLLYYKLSARIARLRAALAASG